MAQGAAFSRKKWLALLPLTFAAAAAALILFHPHTNIASTSEKTRRRIAQAKEEPSGDPPPPAPLNGRKSRIRDIFRPRLERLRKYCNESKGGQAEGEEEEEEGRRYQAWIYAKATGLVYCMNLKV